jgi:energy-coupling factor transporter ATP-binding protein EcfA2
VFSIFQLNPAPFCMLDEVDAPLDDANVGRYARMVKEMSEKVQFVFITHNKITMEMADHLMGVTMHEPGRIASRVRGRGRGGGTGGELNARRWSQAGTFGRMQVRRTGGRAVPELTLRDGMVLVGSLLILAVMVDAGGACGSSARPGAHEAGGPDIPRGAASTNSMTIVAARTAQRRGARIEA